MGKLHELLAVEGGRKQAFSKILEETNKIFANKGILFHEFLKTLQYFNAEDSPDGDTSEREDERLSMTATVPQRLNWMAKFCSDYFDAALQKEAANQKAVADLTLGDGTVLLKEVPATFLLSLESHLARVRAALDRIPTHPAGVEWEPDPDHKFELVYKAKHPEVSHKTKKVVEPFVMYEATDKHPAQIEKLSKDVIVGKYRKHMWVGSLTPAKKAQLLENIDTLIEATRKARQRANGQEVPKVNCGDVLMDYILGKDIRVAGSGSVGEEE